MADIQKTKRLPARVYINYYNYFDESNRPVKYGTFLMKHHVFIMKHSLF